MQKRQKTILFSSIAIVAIVIAIICTVFFNSKSKVLKKGDILGLINKDYTVENIVANEDEIKVVIAGDLSKEDAITIGKELSKKSKIIRLNLVFTNEGEITLEDGFYAEGMLREVEINNKDKKMQYSEFRNENIDINSKINIADLSYNTVRNIEDIVYVDVTSSEINSSNYKEQLFQLAKVVNNTNENLKNVIITAKVDELTYGVALSNPKVIKVIENIEL